LSILTLRSLLHN